MRLVVCGMIALLISVSPAFGAAVRGKRAVATAKAVKPASSRAPISQKPTTRSSKSPLQKKLRRSPKTKTARLMARSRSGNTVTAVVCALGVVGGGIYMLGSGLSGDLLNTMAGGAVVLLSTVVGNESKNGS